jgi:hypothetical protein
MGLIVKRFPEKGIKIRLYWDSETGTVPVLNGHKVQVSNDVISGQQQTENL